MRRAYSTPVSPGKFRTVFRCFSNVCLLFLVTLVLCPALAIGIATAAGLVLLHWTGDGDEHWEIEP